MGIRDDELNRLIRYCQGMGLSVRFKPYVRGSKTAAEWTTDGSEIAIYVTSKCSKVEKILSLIHETAHHKAWIDNKRQIDPKVEEALDSEENKRSHRKRLLDMERNDSIYWEDIYKDTNCQFPIWKLHAQKEMDLWQYEFYYEHGVFPKKKAKDKKRKEICNKHRK